MNEEEIKKMEEWCDWACGNCSRTHVKWKAAQLGYIRGVHDTKQKLGIPAIMQAEGSDGCDGAAVGNSAAGKGVCGAGGEHRSGSKREIFGMRKCLKCGKLI